MKIAVLTVVYPGVEPYLNDFLTSLQNQSEKNFELIIVNDGFSELNTCLNRLAFSSTVLNFTGSFVELRKQAISWLEENDYKFVVFADSDDYFDSRRIEITVELLLNHDIICNDLLLFSEGMSGYKIMGSNRISDGEKVGSNLLFNANILGMSNTGAKVKSIVPILNEIPNNVIAFDWLLYSLALLSGCTCIFTDKTRTYYRQHSNNIASPQNYTDEQIIRGIKVKAQHYGALRNYGQCYQNNAHLFQLLLDRIDDTSFMNGYCQAVRKNAPAEPLWWEAIKTERELNL